MTKFVDVDQTWTLFLDRDGVINARIMGGYVLNYADFHFKQGVLNSAKDLFEKFGRVVVVTNQQCVALAYLTESQLEQIHHQMVVEFKHCGAKVDKVYVAIEKKGDALNMRKPNPTMGYMAKEDFPEIDFSKSIMVGDTDGDISFGKSLGMKTVLIETEENTTVIPDLCVTNLSELNEIL